MLSPKSREAAERMYHDVIYMKTHLGNIQRELEYILAEDQREQRRERLGQNPGVKPSGS